MSLEKSSGTICLALNHLFRRWIIELLEGCGTLSSSELGSILKISTVRLYYHLNKLTGLIDQDRNQQHMLSKEGKRVYRLLFGNNESTVEIFTQPTTLADTLRKSGK